MVWGKLPVGRRVLASVQRCPPPSLELPSCIVEKSFRGETLVKSFRGETQILTGEGQEETPLSPKLLVSLQVPYLSEFTRCVLGNPFCVLGVCVLHWFMYRDRRCCGKVLPLTGTPGYLTLLFMTTKKGGIQWGL